MSQDQEEQFTSEFRDYYSDNYMIFETAPSSPIISKPQLLDLNGLARATELQEQRLGDCADDITKYLTSPVNYSNDPLQVMPAGMGHTRDSCLQDCRHGNTAMMI